MDFHNKTYNKTLGMTTELRRERLAKRVLLAKTSDFEAPKNNCQTDVDSLSSEIDAPSKMSVPDLGPLVLQILVPVHSTEEVLSYGQLPLPGCGRGCQQLQLFRESVQVIYANGTLVFPTRSVPSFLLRCWPRSPIIVPRAKTRSQRWHPCSRGWNIPDSIICNLEN